MRLSLAFVPLLILSVPATAARYVGTESAGSLRADYAITTDGTTGVLSASNILGVSLSIGDGFHGIGAPADHTAVLLGGTAISATDTDIFFDFSDQSAASFRVLFPPGNAEICFGTLGVCGISSGYSLHFEDQQGSSTASGMQSIASVFLAVPEPSSWAMMLLGFVAIGLGMRNPLRNQTQLGIRGSDRARRPRQCQLSICGRPLRRK